MFGFRYHVNEFQVGNIVSRSSFTTFQSVSCLPWRTSQSKFVARWGKKGDDFADDPDWGMKCHRTVHTRHPAITPVQKGTGPSREDPGLINNHTLLNPHMQCCLPTLLPPKDPSWRTQSAQQNTCCLLERVPMSVHNEALRRVEKSTGWPCACTLPLQEVNRITCF